MKPKDKIIRRRKQVIVNSFIYYHLGDSVVSDAFFDALCKELVDLHSIYGVKHDFYDGYFEDWHGETGMHFPMEEWVVEKSLSVIRHRDRQ